MFKALRYAIVVVALLLALPWAYIYANTFFNDWVGVETDYASSPRAAGETPVWEEPFTLRVVTFNIQDLLVVASDHEERMAAIARKLGELDPDIVGFQESFIEEHRQVLLAGLREHTRLDHFQYYPSAKMGSGLLTASAYPIDEVFFHRFTGSNPWWKVWEGDYWAGKGVSLARIELPGGRLVDFYNTHAQADYGVEANRLVRQGQMRELAEFVNASRLGRVPVFVVGDLNSRPGSEEYEAAVVGADLVRVMTIDSRIDHVLAARSDDYDFQVTETIEISERIVDGDKEYRLSDHPGYLSEVTVTPVTVEKNGPA